jgi:hypothetical protein
VEKWPVACSSVAGFLLALFVFPAAPAGHATGSGHLLAACHGLFTAVRRSIVL